MAILMTHRMRKQMEAWRAKHDDLYEPEEYEVMYAKEKERLWKHEVEDAKARAYLKAIENGEAARIREAVRANEFGKYPALEEYKDVLKEHTAEKSDGYFVTVNPKPDVNLAELQKAVTKYVGSKMIGDVEYVFEQRGATELEAGKGMHVHLLVPSPSTNAQDFTKRTRNAFKNLVGIPDRHVDIRGVTAGTYEAKREYMRGGKTGAGKAQKVLIDKIWRSKNNILAYYKQDAKQEDNDPAEGGGDCAEGRASEHASEDGSIHT